MNPTPDATTPTTPGAHAMARLARGELYGGFWRRVGALVVDWLVLSVPTFLLGVFAALSGSASFEKSDNALSEFAANFAPVLMAWLYHTLLESSPLQATVGKALLGIKVTDSAGERVSFWRAGRRNLFKVFSTLSFLIGYLITPFTRRKQALHHLLAGCLVLRQHVTPESLRATLQASGEA